MIVILWGVSKRYFEVCERDIARCLDVILYGVWLWY